MYRNYFKTVLFLFLIHFTASQLQGQNLLDFSNWTVGTGSALPFVKYGLTSENERLNYTNNVGEPVIAWRGESSGPYGQSGGWTTQTISIDNSQTYMMTVWIKKENSNDGRSGFGLYSNLNGSSQVRSLTTNNSITHPKFYFDKLPELNKWYLLVAYIHDKDYTGTISPSVLYDGDTGKRLESITGYKFSPSATTLQHRAFLYTYTSNVQDVQYMADPAIYVVDGTEPSIEVLLNSNPGSSLVFAFDNAGSQKQRFYCNGDCVVPPPPDGLVDPNDSSDISKETQEEISSADKINLSISPNPTSGIASILLLDQDDVYLSHSIIIFNSRGSTLKTIALGQETQEITIDISSFPAGVYTIHAHLSNGEAITKQLIKK